MWGAWKNTTGCTLSNPDEGCGQGNMMQNRTCRPGNIESCVEPFEIQKINCSIPCPTTGIFVSFDIKYYRLTNC